ncbi:unnamed protein product [Brassica rapa subsp. trilocularis]
MSQFIQKPVTSDNLRPNLSIFFVFSVFPTYELLILVVLYHLETKLSSFSTMAVMCEALLMYPRTYDLFHVDGLFTSQRCEMTYVMLEMDRILRPNGY